MKNIFRFIFFSLFIFSINNTTLIYTKKNKTTYVNQNEYNSLLKQCLEFKRQFLQLYSFDKIKQETLKNFNENTLPRIAERFASLEGNQRSGQFLNALSSGGAALERDLNCQEVYYNIQLRNALIENVSTFLRNIGTPAAIKLLSDLAKTDFFYNLKQG